MTARKRSTAKKATPSKGTTTVEENKTEQVEETTTTETPDVAMTEAPETTKANDTPESGESETAPAPEAKSVVEKPNVLVIDDTNLTAAGKAFFNEVLKTDGVTVGKGDIPLDHYSAENIKAAYFSKLASGEIVSLRLNEFIFKTMTHTVEARERAYNMFKMLVHYTESLDQAAFNATYKALTEFVGNDIRVGGFFSDVSSIAALRNDAAAASFFKLLQRLVPAQNRKEVAVKTNYTEACKLFKKEQSREWLEVLFR